MRAVQIREQFCFASTKILPCHFSFLRNAPHHPPIRPPRPAPGPAPCGVRRAVPPPVQRLHTTQISIIDRSALQGYCWQYLIIDEGQRIKNASCRLVQELKKLPSENRLLLSGTPIQNTLEELWSLLNFVNPHIFDDLSVRMADGGGIYFSTVYVREEERERGRGARAPRGEGGREGGRRDC